MRRKFFKVLIFLCFATVSSTAQTTVSVTVTDARNGVKIKIDSPKALPPPVVTQLLRAGSYTLTEERRISPDFAERLVAANAIADASERFQRLSLIANELGPPRPNLINPLQTTPFAVPNGTRIELRLVSALEYGKTYNLLINGLTSDENPAATMVAVKLPAEPTGEILPALDAFSRTEIRIRSIGPVQGDKVGVKARTYRLRHDSMDVEEQNPPQQLPAFVDATKSSPPNEVTINLGKRLKDNQSYELVVNGLTDGDRPLKEIVGSVKFPGLPSPPDDPRWDISLASAAAVNQKPEFNLTAKINPRSPERLDRKGWLWQPMLEIDVGLGATKSNNSITLAAPFVRSIIQPPYIATGDEPPALLDVRGADIRQKRQPKELGSKIPHYKNWSVIPWLHISDTVFSIGPKIETDRKFQRINTLGTVRFDFHLPRMMATIKQRRGLVKKDLGDKSDFVSINHGFRVVPYVSFDFGAHANNETVKKGADNKELSILVPRHGIFRAYLGLAGVFEWRTFSIPTTLKFEESIVYLSTREKIGYSTEEGVFLRQLRGIHPHFKTSLGFAFDPAKHYSFDITFENGRLAPNFEYLNKLTAGIRLVY